MLHTTRRIFFSDVDEKVRTLTGCSLLVLDEFVQISSIIATILDASEDSFAEVYTKDRTFSQFCHKVLRLHNIDPQWINIEILAEMLLPHYSGDEIKLGLLQQVSLPQSDNTERSAKQVTMAEYISQSLAALVTSELATDVGNALDIGARLTATETNEILAARAGHLGAINKTPAPVEGPPKVPSNPTRPTSPPGGDKPKIGVLDGWVL